MDLDLEQQLTTALERRASGVPLPPTDLAGVRSRARSIRRRRVAAGGVASAAVVALVLPLAWGLGGLRGTHEPPVATQSPTPSPTATCSSTGVPRPPTPTDLPAPVLKTWQRLVDAAAACDVDAVEALVSRQTALTTGGGNNPDLRQLEERGEGRLGILLKVLSLSHAENTQVPGSYAWPAAYARPTWEAVTQAERDELRAIHTRAEIAGFDAARSYMGWRVGIAADGTWQFFTAGD